MLLSLSVLLEKPLLNRPDLRKNLPPYLETGSDGEDHAGMEKSGDEEEAVEEEEGDKHAD